MTAPETCRSCGAPVLWAKTAKGKQMPLEPEPRPNGNLQLVNGVATAALPLDQGPRYVSHFATCPDASQHRRPR